MQIDERIKESEVRYRRLFESAKDGILILDFETGNIVDANPFIIKMMGYTLNEVLGKMLWEIGLFNNREQSEQAFVELKKNGYIRYEDMPVQGRDGRITEVEFISNVYLENNNKVIQCNIRDITARKKIERALEESLDRIGHINTELVAAKVKAEESDNLKTAFLANMSHEIRTPMNAIVGFSGFLLEPGLSKEKHDSFVQIINSSSLQLLSVISDIIDTSKIESGQLTVESKLVNINSLMNEVFVIYEKIVERKKLSLICTRDRPNDLIQIESDGNRIKQILCNLLNNSIKFTKEGKIEFGYKIKENSIAFFVKDTGIGIAQENHALIFQRFRQVKTTNNQIYSGNGLGLSISNALVEKMGGSMSVNSKLGGGSTFAFTVPYVKNIETMETALTNKTYKTQNWNEKTVLIVEDDINNHSYLEELFSGTKIKILHAWDGEEAVTIVEKHPDISLVLMDVKMPLLDGLSATQIIKNIRPKLPVIVQTSNALSQDKKIAIEAGCDDYFSKPIDTELLMEKIGNYLA
jgi:PAS domain S-box-containing protein